MQIVRAIRNVLYSEIDCATLIWKLKRKIMEKTTKYGPGPEDSTDEGWRRIKATRPPPSLLRIQPGLVQGAQWFEFTSGQFAPQIYYAPNIVVAPNEEGQLPERELEF